MLYTKYLPKSESGLINILLSLILMFIIAAFLGWLYNLNTFIPIVYFNFLFTIGFGFAIAFSTQIIGKFLKIKKRKTRLYIAIFGALIAYYSSWIAFILFMVLGSFPNLNDFFSYFIYPLNFFNIIAEMNRYGTWGIGFIRDAYVNGYPLTVVWIVEAFIIFFIPIAYTYKFPENPYSEKKNKWYNKLLLNYEFASVYSENRFLENLKQNGIELILNMERGLPYKYAAFSIFFLEGEDNQYLSIDNIFIEVRNKSKKNVTPILTPIKISNEEAKKLISKFGTKKEFFLDF